MGEALIESIDYLSTRRLQGYIIGLKRLWERPFLGHGLHQVKLYIPYRPPVEIHNLWLKWGVYSGVLAPTLLLAMVASILRAGWRIYRDGTRTEKERDMSGALGLIIIAGLVVSLLEINIPLGAFQLSAIWWAAAGSLVGIAQNRHPTS